MDVKLTDHQKKLLGFETKPDKVEKKLSRPVSRTSVL